MTIHPDDDVARNIQTEQQRDAMPSPEEAAAEAERHLRETGCEECGATDLDTLDARTVAMPSCSAVQHPPDPMYVSCDACFADRPALRERAFEKAHHENERGGGTATTGDVLAVAFYECENWQFVTQPLADDGTGAKHPHPFEPPSAPIECRCGAALAEVVRLEDDDDDPTE